MKFKEFVYRIRRDNPAILWFIVFLIFLVLGLLIDLFLHFKSDRSINIAEAQLIVEIFGLVALILAILEFVEISKKPKLKLWVEYIDADAVRHLSDESIDRYHEKSPFIIEKGRVDQDIIKSNIISFRFKLFIENFGKKIGRFVKVTIKLIGEDSSRSIQDKMVSVNRIGNNELGIWLKGGLNRGVVGNFQRFHGGEKFVVYSHPAKVDNFRDWLEELGEFLIYIPAHVGMEINLDLKLFCTIQADEYDLQTQIINISIP